MKTKLTASATPDNNHRRRAVRWSNNGISDQSSNTTNTIGTNATSLPRFAVLRARHSPNDTLRAEIEATVVSHLGKALKPHAVLFTEELPRTRNGKILRRLVRQSYLGEPPGDLSALENPSALKAVASAK